MFKALYAVAQHTPLHLAVTPQDGGRLKVIVTPLPTGKAKDFEGLSKQFSATGTPDELDAEFVPALATYAAKVNEVRAEISLPISALDADKAKADKKAAKQKEKEERAAEEEKRRSEAAKKAAETRAANKAEADRQAKEKAEQRAAAKAEKKAKKDGGTLPGQTTPAPGQAWPFPTEPGDEAPAGARSESMRIDLPGKPECIRDYQQMALKYGAKLTRRLFIKKSETARRYERLWKNWEAFVKDATAQQALQLEEDTRALEQADAEQSEARNQQGPAAPPAQQEASHVEGTGSAGPADEAIEGSNPSGSATQSAAAPESNSSSQRSPAPAADPKTISIAAALPERGPDCGGCKHLVYTAPNGQIPLKPYPHARCGHLGVDVSMAVDKSGSILSCAIPEGCPTHPNAHAADPKPHKVYSIAGDLLGESKYADTLGEKIDHCGLDRVIDHVEGRRYTAHLHWTVYAPDGAKLGTVSQTPEVGQRITLGGKDYTVFEVGEQDCSAAPARTKTPAAQPAAATTE